MICPKCNSQLPDNATFCANCGTAFGNFQPQQEQFYQQPQNFQQPQQGQFYQQPQNFQQPQQEQFYQQPQNFQQPQQEQPQQTVPPVIDIPKKKKKKILPVIAIAAAVIVAAGAGFAAFKFLLVSKNICVYVADGNYEIMNNPKKNDGFKFSSLKNSEGKYAEDDFVKFSKDGKYVYYIANYSDYSGKLYRAECSKLKEDSAQNDKYIENIASDVCGFEVLDNGNVIYTNSDNVLYFNDGKDRNSIGKKVARYEVKDDYIIYSSYSDDKYDVYCVPLKNMDDKKKVASNCDTVIDISDVNNIIYGKMDKDYTYTLYQTGINKDSEKIASNAEIMSYPYENNCMYYTVKSKDSLSLYDFVEDSFKSDDEKLKEPDENDYSVPSYSYSMISGDKVKESDYDELYTSCTQKLYWYGESTKSSYSMEDSFDTDWGEDTDDINEATQNFIEKFASKSNSDGYILVTDEVKAALKEINKYNPNRNKENADNQWLWLCYSCKETGETFDYDSYEEDLKRYEKAENRIKIREKLQQKNNNIPLKELYCYKNGKSELVCDSIIDIYNRSSLFLYNTTDVVKDKNIDISDVSSIVDVESLLYIDYSDKNYILPKNKSVPIQISDKVADELDSFEDSKESFDLYYRSNSLLIHLSNNELYASQIKNCVAESIEMVTDDSENVIVEENSLYYISDRYEDDDNYYSTVTLNEYKNGKSNKIASDVILSNLRIYDDNSILAYTNYRKRSGYELTLFDSKGNKSIIGDDITKYIRMSKNELLYVSDDDLYYYDGKKRMLIADDVKNVWCLNEVKPKSVLYY